MLRFIRVMVLTVVGAGLAVPAARGFAQAAPLSGAKPSGTVAVALLGEPAPRLVLAHKLAGRSRAIWRYRTFDLSLVPSSRRASVDLSGDGTAARLLATSHASDPLYIDLTRRERGVDGELIDRRPGPHGPSDAATHLEERAIREALLAGDPCRPAGETGIEQRRRRCIHATYTSAERLDSGDHPAWPAAASWLLFRVHANVPLYLPALQMAPAEEVFPSAFDALPTLPGARDFPSLFRAYLRATRESRVRHCRVYYQVHTDYAGVWLIQYWFYFPFDYGGQGSHFHDSEHVFVEVDLLGGWVRRVMGAGHGALAGNNIYEATRTGAAPADLPLLATVEMGKHATAPDIDRDFVFTPGIDENLYNERAKVWGVRDVIGDNNNHIIAYERTMSAPRRPADVLAGEHAAKTFRDHPDLRDATCTCQLLPIAPFQTARPEAACAGSAKETPSAACARKEVVGNPDFDDPSRIFKNGLFPPRALRFSWTMGPRSNLMSYGLGYASDISAVPLISRYIKLPGRLALEGQWWHQDVDTKRDPGSCPLECQQERGWGGTLRYEQLVSNLFGTQFGVRYFRSDGSPSILPGRNGGPRPSELWFVFGPMAEFSLPPLPNLGVQAAMAFRQGSSPRYELRAHIALYRFAPKRVGVNRP